jgi:hypothetical protein
MGQHHFLEPNALGTVPIRRLARGEVGISNIEQGISNGEVLSCGAGVPPARNSCGAGVPPAKMQPRRPHHNPARFRFLAWMASPGLFMNRHAYAIKRSMKRSCGHFAQSTAQNRIHTSPTRERGNRFTPSLARFEDALFRILAEGHIHRSLGQRPRDMCITEVIGRRPYSQYRSNRREYGLRPNSVSVFNSWGDAPGYGEYGLRPRTQAQITQLQDLRVGL